MTLYQVRVVGSDSSDDLNSTVCTTSPCIYVHQVTHLANNYSIYVSSINQDATLGSENSTTFGELNHSLL